MSLRCRMRLVSDLRLQVNSPTLKKAENANKYMAVNILCPKRSRPMFGITDINLSKMSGVMGSLLSGAPFVRFNAVSNFRAGKVFVGSCIPNILQ